jgi:hypothetical protein
MSRNAKFEGVALLHLGIVTKGQCLFIDRCRTTGVYPERLMDPISHRSAHYYNPGHDQASAFGLWVPPTAERFDQTDTGEPAQKGHYCSGWTAGKLFRFGRGPIPNEAVIYLSPAGDPRSAHLEPEKNVHGFCL